MSELISKSWCWQTKGEPEALILKEQKVRALKEDEVLIQNSCIGLNPVDWKLIEWGHPEWQNDHVPGVDGVGVILKTGKNMDHIPIGARVAYHTDLSKSGSFSTHTVAMGNRLIHLPERLSELTAASFPCPSLTAWQSFQKIPDVANKKVLVSGAGGSVGYFLTQLLLQHKARVYVTSSPKHHEEFMMMGVVKAMDYKTPHWQNEMKEALDGALFDVVFDTVSGEHVSGLMHLLGYYGHIVAIQDRVDKNPLPAFSNCVSLHEIALGAFHQYASEQQIAQLMREGETLLNQIGNGTLKLRRQSVDTFENLPHHLAEMKRNNSEIKYVIKV